MSWIKRRGQSGTSPAPPPATTPPVPMYNPNQHSSQQWQQVDLNTPTNNWYDNQPQQQPPPPPQQSSNYWQQPSYQQQSPQQYQQQTQHYQDPPNNDYYRQSAGNAAIYQQQQHVQGYQQPQQQQQPQQHQPIQQQQQQQYSYPQQQQSKTENNDAWGWTNWGDEDNSNLQTVPDETINANVKQGNVGDSFTADQTWNWSLEDKKAATLGNNQNLQNVEELFPKVSTDGGATVVRVKKEDNFPPQDSSSVENMNFEQKREKSEQVTPQWSIESQLSQDSSDDILQTSDSDRSHHQQQQQQVAPVVGGVLLAPLEGGGGDNKQVLKGRQFPSLPVNMESLPDNAEQPDRLMMMVAPSDSVQRDGGQLLPENNEVAPQITDRNQYLETGQLSDDNPTLSPPNPADLTSNNYNNRQPLLSQPVVVTTRPEEPPPPAFTRVVVGQRNANSSPGGGDLSPQVATSTNTNLPASTHLQSSTVLPSIGGGGGGRQLHQMSSLHRMVTGESSPPGEAVNVNTAAGGSHDNGRGQGEVRVGQNEVRSQNQAAGAATYEEDDDDDSAFDENELVDISAQPRSATIGADDNTSPGISSMTLNRSETIGGATSASSNSTGGVTGTTTERETVLDGANTLDDNPPPPVTSSPSLILEGGGNSRGEVIDGGEPTTSGDMASMASSMRSLSIGGSGGDAQLPDIPRRLSKHEISEESTEEQPHSRKHKYNSGNYASNDNTGQNVGGGGGGGNTGHSRRDGNNRRGEKPPVAPSHQHNTDRERDRRHHGYDYDYQQESINTSSSQQKRRGQSSRHHDDDTDYGSEVEEEEVRNRRGGGNVVRQIPPPGGASSSSSRRRERVERGGGGGLEGEEYSRGGNNRRDKDKYNPRGGNGREYEREGASRRGGGGGGEEYYRGGGAGRYEYDDDVGSRASSRSESLHDMYRDRRSDRDRDRDHRRPPRHDNRDRDTRRYRDPYNNTYMQGYGGYDPYSPYYMQQQYQYYENLRRTNPQAYAEWYRKFYGGHHPQTAQTGGGGAALSTTTSSITAATGGDDRASLHSGSSSTNDDLARERYLRQSYYGHSVKPRSYYRELETLSSHYGLDDSSVSRPFDYTDSSFKLESTASLNQQQHQQQRLALALFTTAHVRGKLLGGGGTHLLQILPQYNNTADDDVMSSNGGGTSIELVPLGELLANDEEYQEMARFPGPLVRGVTHKKTVIEYCEEKIRNAREYDIVDCDSYILIWELLILLLRQNGMVVGTDIAELLMKNNRQPTQQLEHNLRPSSVNSNTSSGVLELQTTSECSNGNGNTASNVSNLKEDVVTNKFREYLIYGSGKEALEWAMKHGLWGHALFLASKLDKRTYANVMKRFANGLPINDPLQTLYQLLSGSLPAAVTCVSDDRWGDWRPHLAMILSNSTGGGRTALDRRAILTLGATLHTRGSLYAAQFCYLMAQVQFSAYGTEGARLVLLGGDITLGGGGGDGDLAVFRRFATSEAIHMTEVYEYACTLNDDGYFIPQFQSYKHLIATRLADHGFVERALGYLERVTTILLSQAPSSGDNSVDSIATPALVARVCQLADRLRYSDPADDLRHHTEGETNEEGEVTVTWLEKLEALNNDYNMGRIIHNTNSNLEPNPTDLDSMQFQEQPDQTTTYDQQVWQQQQPLVEQQQQQLQQPWDINNTAQVSEGNLEFAQPAATLEPSPTDLSYNQYQDQSSYYQGQQSWGNSQQQSLDHQQQQQDDQLQSHDSLNYWNQSQNEDISTRPQISMPNQSSKSSFDDDTLGSSNSLQSGQKSTKSGADGGKNAKNNTATKAPSTGWFNGIFGRLSMRPKNQMKLPDDKNPTIVWDPAKKRWVNTEEDTPDGASELRPPPKMADLMPKQPASLPNLATPQGFPNNGGVALQQSQLQQPTMINGSAAPLAVADGVTGKPPMQPNMFKMQRGRNLKKAYVDIFNPGGGGTATGGSAPSMLTAGAASDVISPMATAPLPPGGQNMNFFTPAAPVDHNAPTDFLTPTTGTPSIDHNAQYQTNE